MPEDFEGENGPENLDEPPSFFPYDGNLPPREPGAMGELIEVSMRLAANDARTGERPLWFGEFGIFNQAPGGEASLTRIYDLADELRAGTAVWELDDPNYGPVERDGTLIMPRALTLARAYPLRVGGTLDAVAFDAQTSTLDVRWTQADKAGDTVLVLPSMRYPGPLTITSSPGVEIVEREDGKLVLSAPPGPAQVSVGT